MQNYDHYFEAREIARDLRSTGLSKEAEKIECALSEGVSGTEIFMQIRYYLSPVVESKFLSKEIRERIGILIEKIDDALSV